MMSFPINPIGGGGYGNYSGGMNGIAGFAVTSANYTEKLQRLFENAFNSGYNITDPSVQEQIFNEAHCTTNDLTEFDKERLIRRIESLSESANTRRY